MGRPINITPTQITIPIMRVVTLEAAITKNANINIITININVNIAAIASDIFMIFYFSGLTGFVIVLTIILSLVSYE